MFKNIDNFKHQIDTYLKSKNLFIIEIEGSITLTKVLTIWINSGWKLINWSKFYDERVYSSISILYTNANVLHWQVLNTFFLSSLSTYAFCHVALNQKLISIILTSHIFIRP